MERVEVEPDISTRRIGVEVRVSQFVVRRTLNFPRRVIYCKYREGPKFLNCILFTDEAGFTRNAIFNSHNTHIWSDENLHARQEVRFQRPFSINVRAGIINDV